MPPLPRLPRRTRQESAPVLGRRSAPDSVSDLDHGSYRATDTIPVTGPNPGPRAQPRIWTCRGLERGRSRCVPPPLLPRTRARTRIPSLGRAWIRTPKRTTAPTGVPPRTKTQRRTHPEPGPQLSSGFGLGCDPRLAPRSPPDAPRPQPPDRGSLGAQPAALQMGPWTQTGTPASGPGRRVRLNTDSDSESDTARSSHPGSSSDAHGASYLVSRPCPNADSDPKPGQRPRSSTPKRIAARTPVPTRTPAQTPT
ncbi:hypothetical protein HJG60_010024 [Phyllostomus discolor]|uniref:Uncharacterized protein n=1 Tax=Phyllostomus discolor TaxID=89673 RepID=A0A834AS44_9CHIR|nr:hypothetical protein HJG60_010024 [Phyllostomus discolor]